MSTIMPPSEVVASTKDPASQGRRRWRRWLERPWVRTLRGLLVLGAIVGGLVAVDQLGGGSGALGPLDGRTPDLGEPAPDFALRDPEGKVRELSDFRGQPVWINFWASWCGPCKRELPDIQGLANELEGEGLVVLAVNLEESADAAVSFFEELGVDLPILLDSNGDVAEQYRLVGLPNNFFIDRDGTLRASDLGFLTEEQMRERLAELGLGSGGLLDAQ